MFSPSYYRSPGVASEFVLHLSPSHFPPLSVPFELQNHMTKDVWSYRIPAIIETASRYSKPRLELVWCLIGFMTTLIVPLALHQMVFSDMGRGTKEYALRQVEARGIAFGIFGGLMLFFLLPLVAWKFIGGKQMKSMLRRWSDTDRINSGHKDPIPVWRVKTPKILREKITVTITVPLKLSASTFHPNAYLPSYINGPLDAEANYYYPYKREPGLPRMSTIGNIPLYLDEKRSFNDVRV